MAQDDPALKDPQTLRSQAAATRARISANINTCERRLREHLPGAPGNGDMRAARYEANFDEPRAVGSDALQILFAGAAAGYQVTRWWRNWSARRR